VSRLPASSAQGQRAVNSWQQDQLRYHSTSSKAADSETLGMYYGDAAVWGIKGRDPCISLFTCPPPRRRQGPKLRNRETQVSRNRCPNSTPTQTRNFTPRATGHLQPGPTPGFHYRHPNILRSPFMGSASPDATALLLSAVQLTAVGSAFPYSTTTAGLNKTDASFASLVRQVGDGGPP
jgi:hypothetical protein